MIPKNVIHSDMRLKYWIERGILETSWKEISDQRSALLEELARQRSHDPLVRDVLTIIRGPYLEGDTHNTRDCYAIEA